MRLLLPVQNCPTTASGPVENTIASAQRTASTCMTAVLETVVGKRKLSRLFYLAGVESLARNRTGLGGSPRVTLAGDVLSPIGIFSVVLVLAGTMWGQRLELKALPPASVAARESEEICTPTA